MRAPHLTPPIALYLPGGVIADYVPESDPPAYTVGGEPIAVDVLIPDDLARAGWFWFGSFLSKPYQNGVGISISTATFPTPGWPCDRQTCFDAAREIERVRAEHEAARLARPVKPTKTKKAKAAPVVLVQETMQL